MSRLKKPFALAVLFALVVGLVAMPLAIAAPPPPPPPIGPSGVLATVSVSISSEAALVTPSSGKRLRIRAALLRSDTAGVVVFRDGTAGTVLAKIYLAANTNLLLTPADLFGADGIALSAADNVLTGTLGSATLTATFRYTEE